MQALIQSKQKCLCINLFLGTISAAHTLQWDFTPDPVNGPYLLYNDWNWALYFNKLFLIEKIIHSGDYKHNYAHSFFRKDFKNLNIKVIRRE